MKKELICKQCSKHFLAYPSQNRVFCCYSCKAKYQRISMAGRNNPNWKETKNLRAPAKRSLRIHIKARDMTCQDCNSDKSLQVHHIDRNPKHNDDGNLVLLCKKCHAKRHMDLGEHTIAKLILANKKSPITHNLTCKNCGKSFISKSNRKKCCSDLCAKQSMKKSKLGKLAWNKGINDIIVTCYTCRKQFTKSAGRLDPKENKPHFCSKLCQIRYAIKCRVKKQKARNSKS